MSLDPGGDLWGRRGGDASPGRLAGAGPGSHGPLAAAEAVFLVSWGAPWPAPRLCVLWVAPRAVGGRYVPLVTGLRL